MKNLITILFVVALTSCISRRSCELRHSHPNPEAVKQSLREIIFPDVEMRFATLHDALELLIHDTQEYDTKGVHPKLWYSPDVVAMVEAPLDPFAEQQGPQITISNYPKMKNNSGIKNMNYLDLLEEICRQANLEWSITPETILITKKRK